MFREKLVLIVEDNAFIALDLSQAIEELDGRVAGPTAQVAEAVELLDSEEIAAAIVDCHLKDQDIVGLAGKLAEREVPFILQIETNLPEPMGTLHPDVPVLRKPIQPQTVMECLIAEMHKVAGRISYRFRNRN
jgi:CheY-like chemotaxis protein